MSPGPESETPTAITAPLVPSNLSQISPAAVPSIDDAAEDPPSPASVNVPSVSEETVTECSQTAH